MLGRLNLFGGQAPIKGNADLLNRKQRRLPGPRFVATRAWPQPLSGELPEPLRATDGRKPDAPPEDVFTLDTITQRMPKIMQSVVKGMPEALKTESFEQNIQALQDEMRDGAQLRPLASGSARVGADGWNEHLSEFIERGEGWHTAPWWVVENYMYKRLLEDGLVDFRVECGAYIE
ncbi:spaT [Symbiodinium pilosum]|uniref:Sugar phosphate phosphatase n=1 Tax=Symbiodinium pilosum TaxID=2952 RepID=A0A812Y4U0_SYMPI|nr:spaT [Symbiodinium pilosum]